MMASPSSSAAAAVALYRRLLRIQRRWPAEPDRPGRSVKEALLAQVRKQFREVRGEPPLLARVALAG